MRKDGTLALIQKPEVGISLGFHCVTHAFFSAIRQSPDCIVNCRREDILVAQTIAARAQHKI